MGDYPNWYEFKRDLEKENGRPLVNSDWLSVKPATALPWDRSLLLSSLDRLARLKRGHLMLPANGLGDRRPRMR